MESVRDALVLATIKEGASNPSNKRFSTKTIAERCGVSEFTLFSLFKTKDVLVEEALEKVRQEFVASARSSVRSSSDVASLVKALVYHAFAMPESTIFFANYGFWTGKIEADPAKKDALLKRDVAAAKEAFIFLEDYPDDIVYLVWNYVWRQINYAVEEVYDGFVRDSRAYRDYVATLVSQGFFAFAKGAE
jgi:AcrR family transcriptional regulator